jgi:hypothetical protein
MNQPSPSLPAPPAATRRWAAALLALAVTVPLSMAPLLGSLKIPGFQALLSLFPHSLQQTALPLASVAMALVAVSVQFFSRDSFSGRKLTRAFTGLVSLLFVLLLVLAWRHNQSVVRIEVGQEGEHAAYVVAAQRRADCPCPANSGDAHCIMRIGLDASRLPLCWPERDIRQNGFVLTLLYVMLMSGLGALVGLLVMVRTQRKSARRRKAAAPAAVE